MSAPQPLHFRYAYDGRGEAAFADYVLHEYSQVHAVDRVGMPRMVLTALVYLGLSIFGGIWVVRRSMHDGTAFGVVLGVVIWLPFMFYIFRNHKTESMVESLRQTRDTAARQTAMAVELTIDTAGIRMSYDAGETLYRWKNFTEVIVLDTHVVIAYAYYFGGICIPRGAFTDDAHLQQSLESIRAFLLSCGVDDTSRIRDFLASRHVRCTCGHDLYGLTTPICPECGTSWRFHTLSMHAYVQDPKQFSLPQNANAQFPT